jgi:hypothetical protein
MIQGDNPVHEYANLLSPKSRPGHVLSWLKIGGPSSKAKYSLPTDSELVP